MGSWQVALYPPAEFIPFKRLKGKWSKYLFRRRETGQEIMEKVTPFDSFADFICKQGFCSPWRTQ